MVIETLLVMSGLAFVVIFPITVVVFLIVAVWKKLGRNPMSATQMSLGMIAVLLLVLLLTVATILIVYQLFSSGALEG